MYYLSPTSIKDLTDFYTCEEIDVFFSFILTEIIDSTYSVNLSTYESIVITNEDGFDNSLAQLKILYKLLGETKNYHSQMRVN